MFWYLILPGIIFLIFFVIGIIVSIQESDGDSLGGAIIAGIFLGLLVAGLGGSIAKDTSPSVQAYQTVDKGNPIYLHSLASDKNLSGSFSGGYLLVVGGIQGKISEEDTYHYLYFVEGKSGGFTSDQADQSNSLVFEDTETDPYFYRITYTITCPEQHPTIFQLENCDRSNIPTTNQFSREFHIPPNSVVKEYSIQP